MRHWMAGLLALAALAASTGSGIGVTTAFASEAHAFDPYLSLTGGCTTSSKDPVPDPGCPNGPLPPQPLEGPRGVATDAAGDIYVASLPNAQSTGRIDIFNSEGIFITEIPNIESPFGVAVDSKGNLYVYSSQFEKWKVLRYAPSAYEPATDEIAYSNPPVTAVEGQFPQIPRAIAINRTDDHLFVDEGSEISEYGSAEDDNEKLGVVVNGLAGQSPTLAVDAADDRIYAGNLVASSPPRYVISVFDLTTHSLLMTVDGSDTPAGKFLGSSLPVAADEATGHFFVLDGEGAKVVYEFDEAGNYVETIQHEFKYVPFEQIAVDNGPQSPNGGLNSGRYLYVPSEPGGIGHLYAFGPSSTCAPQVESLGATEITPADALLTASIEPCGAATTYVFEYTTQLRFEAEGFANAQNAGEGAIPAGKVPREVSAPATGLSPDTAYRYRVVARNSVDSDAAEATFRTYPLSELGSCPNSALRTGFSAALADCRAYELVTPPDTNAQSPKGVDHLGIYFSTREASPAGKKLSFRIEGGVIPGSPGTGSFAGDPYLSSRGASGWTTSLAGPTAQEIKTLLPGSTSPDQGYSFWNANSQEGPAATPGVRNTAYVRYPDGHSELVGRGSFATDPQAAGKLISENGGHIIFVSGEVSGKTLGEEAVQLEPTAPPDGTAAIYDRTSDGVTHVISLLPGDKTPKAGENAKFLGASLDGRGVAFTIGNALYLRHDDSATFKVAEAVTFAGVAEGGGRVFYVQGGNLKAFDADSGSTIAFSTSGNATPVNVAPGGAVAYFVSPSALTGKAANPNGVKPIAGQDNLYRSREGLLSFIGTVTERDVVGREIGGVESVEGLGLWVSAAGGIPGELPGRYASDPSRSTPDGSSLIFESRANLTSYDSAGHVEVYLFNSQAPSLRCLSCSPTGTPPSGDASLQSVSIKKEGSIPLSAFGAIENLRADGRRAFFQTTEALVPADTDGLQDVYEWEEPGVGTCARPAGCVNLISSGTSGATDYLYALSASGDDVFFSTADLLLPADVESTPSIYDARVEGGFPEPQAAECQGEGCRPSLSGVPPLPAPGSRPNHRSGNVSSRCPKGKHRVKRKAKVKCVRKHHRHHHHRAGTKKKGAGK